MLKGEERPATPLLWTEPVACGSSRHNQGALPTAWAGAPAVSGTGSASCCRRGLGFRRRGPGFACWLL